MTEEKKIEFIIAHLYIFVLSLPTYSGISDNRRPGKPLPDDAHFDEASTHPDKVRSARFTDGKSIICFVPPSTSEKKIIRGGRSLAAKPKEGLEKERLQK